MPCCRLTMLANDHSPPITLASAPSLFTRYAPTTLTPTHSHSLLPPRPPMHLHGPNNTHPHPTLLSTAFPRLTAVHPRLATNHTRFHSPLPTHPTPPTTIDIGLFPSTRHQLQLPLARRRLAASNYNTRHEPLATSLTTTLANDPSLHR